jgi:hypothetical protein
MSLINLPLICLTNIVSLLHKDWKSISSLRRTCKKFNIPELRPYLPQLKSLVLFQDVKETILSLTSEDKKKECSENLANARLKIKYKYSDDVLEMTIIIKWNHTLEEDHVFAADVTLVLEAKYDDVFDIVYLDSGGVKFYSRPSIFKENRISSGLKF